jgi:hypothetical protein
MALNLNPQEDVYIDFLNYDWASFTEYQEGLDQILQNYLQTLQESDDNVREIPLLDKQQLINQAQSFFYCNHTGNIIELDSYMQWRAVNGDKYLKNKNITEVTDDDVEPTITTVAAEKPELSKPQEFTAKSSTKNTSGSTENQNQNQNQNHNENHNENQPSSSQPPYSSNYKELVELILSGKEVPGIKQIPNTVLTEQESKASATQRTKPWEK